MTTRHALLGPHSSADGYQNPIRLGVMQAYASAMVKGPLFSPTPPLMVKGSAACPFPSPFPLLFGCRLVPLISPE